MAIYLSRGSLVCVNSRGLLQVLCSMNKACYLKMPRPYGDDLRWRMIYQRIFLYQRRGQRGISGEHLYALFKEGHRGNRRYCSESR